MDMSLSCHWICKSLSFRITLFVVKVEMEQLNSLGFNHSGFLCGKISSRVCISCYFLVFCLAFVFISIAW